MSCGIPIQPAAASQPKSDDVGFSGCGKLGDVLKRRILSAFQKWDATGGGKIPEAQFCSVLLHLGVPESETRKVFETADLNKDDHIDYKEFVEWLYSSSAPSAVVDIVMSGDINSAEAVMNENVELDRSISDVINLEDVEDMTEDDLAKSLSDILSRELGGEPVDPEENLLRRVDSRMICRFNNEIHEAFPERKIEPRALFDFPTVTSLARHIKSLPRKLMGKRPDGKAPDAVVKEISGDVGAVEAPNIAKTTSEEFSGTMRKPFVPSSTDFIQLVVDAELSRTLKTLYERKGPGRFIRGTDGMESIMMPGGKAWIGDGVDGRSALANEQPCHQLELSSFLMDVEPVSVGAYARFLNIVQPPRKALDDWFFPRDDDPRKVHIPVCCGPDRKWILTPGAHVNWPMIMVSWYGANAYSLWANGRDWRQYSSASQSFLPTEAQWEYAARGADVVSFPWGDAAASPHMLNVSWDGDAKVSDIGISIPLEDLPLVHVNDELGLSASGLRGMAGNVWQWCRDTYDPEFYSSEAATQKDAWNDADVGPKSERGGSWVGPPCLARSSYRRGRVADAKGRCLGFRCVGDVQEVSDLMAQSELQGG